MARNMLPSSPEASRLLSDAPFDLVLELLGARDLTRVLDDDLSAERLRFEQGDSSVSDVVRSKLAKLSRERLRHIEDLARRITDLAEPVPDRLLIEMAGGWHEQLSVQRDAIARSLWSFLHANKLFQNVERAHQLQHYRDYRKLHDAYEVETNRPLAAAHIDVEKLQNEIERQLDLTEPCAVEAIDLPSHEDQQQSIMILVTASGPLSSQPTFENRRLDKFFYQPPNQITLVYTPAAGMIEVCALDVLARRRLPAIFAQLSLGQDVSKKPLTWKTYDLQQFRRSLKLAIPPEVPPVERACITELQITWGSWNRLLTLKTTPEDDADDFARSVLGSRQAAPYVGMIIRVQFYVCFLSATSRKRRTLSFTVRGRHSCSLQSEKDPEKRELGFRLLQSWGIFNRVTDFTSDEQRRVLPLLLELYDFPEAHIPGSFIFDHKIDASRLEIGGYINRTTPPKVVLYEDEVFRTHESIVAPGNDAIYVTVEAAEGVAEGEMASRDLSLFQVNLPYIQQKIVGAMSQLQREGRVLRLSNNLDHLGSVTIDGKKVPAFLARCLTKDDVIAEIDLAIRRETAATKGIVFVAVHRRVPHFGAHVVLAIRDVLYEDQSGLIDPNAVSVRYRSALSSAAVGEPVTFDKFEEGLAILTITGKPPWTIVGAERVGIIERLYAAYKRGVPMRTGAVTSMGHPSNAFRNQWETINGVYLRSPKRGFWELCV